MKAKTTILITISITALLMAALASACGGSEEDSVEWERLEGDFFQGSAAPTAAPAAPAPAMAMSESHQSGQPGLPGIPSPAAPAAAMAKTVQQQEVVEMEVVREVEVEKLAEKLSGSPAQPQQPAQLVTQRRIIIRTVNMSIVVDQIQAAIDDISELADDMGGWVVSTDRSRKHDGSVSIRVPAADLDAAIESLRALAKDVQTEITTSQDVTDEYYDLQSRLKNQQATEAALIRLLDRAENVQHALEVQRELTNVQENVERLLGRIKLLEQTSAFSLITVSLRLAPLDMNIDAGPDQSVAVHSPTRFRATFTPPEGMDEHTITWDFGDGSEPVYISRTAPTTEEGERVTATVTHIYDDPKDSPFIAQVTISSYGESGVAEGEDTLIVTVSETPVIEVFAGDRSYRVLQNEIVEFSGSFTRPPGLANVRYKWDFGDGSPPDEGELAEGVTRVDAAHAYADFRSWPYDAVFTVTADSAVGEIVSSGSVSVYVQRDPGLIAGGFNLADNAKTAVRTLSLVLSGLTTALIWVGIFGIIWIPLVIVIIILVRRGRRFRTQHPPGGPRPPTPQDEPGPGAN